MKKLFKKLREEPGLIIISGVFIFVIVSAIVLTITKIIRGN